MITGLPIRSYECGKQKHLTDKRLIKMRVI